MKIRSLLSGLVLMAYGVGASAHAHLQTASPADGSVITTAPSNLVLAFSEAAHLTVVSIQKGSEPKHALEPPTTATHQISIPLPPLTPGAYVVSWRAVGGDGHVMPGTLHFTVSGGRPTGEEASHSQGDGAQLNQTQEHHHSEDGHDHEHGGANTGAQSRTESEGHQDESGARHSHDEATKPGSLHIATSAAEPVAVVDRFFRELASGNVKAASSLLNPDVLIYESGGAEGSREEYASHHLAEDAHFLQALSHRLLGRTADAAGDLAWVASETKLSGNANGKPVNVVSTETMVLRRTPAGWRIVHIHWSSRPGNRSAVR
jgi:methionine-rich copper-binding protein CopC/ketosteroid isomerase-like protein